MVLSALRPDANLPEFLAHRARSASVQRLSADLVAGLAAMASSFWWRPSVWVLLSGAALCFASYGAWGLADRWRSHLATVEGRIARELLGCVCAASAGIGALGAAAVLYSLWVLALGTWIS